MTIIEYKKGVNEHPTGWEGFRVCVLGASKKYRQKYFRTTDRTTKHYFPDEEIVRIREQAIQLHNEWWQAEQALREMMHDNMYAHFTIDKRNYRPYAAIRIQAQKCINQQHFCLNSTLTGKRKKFQETWDRLLNEYIDRFNPSMSKIKKMKNNMPTFDEMDKKRIKFNRRSACKFSIKQLRMCFEQ